MDPMTMMLIASGVQTGMGLVQSIGAGAKRRKAQREFTPYQIPASAKASLDRAQSIASMRGIPGEDLARSRGMATTARAVGSAQRTAESPSDVLSVLGRVWGSNIDMEQNLAMAGEQAYERRQAGLMNALNRFAGYETERWQYNELYPYMQAMGEAGQLEGAGGQNISGGLNMGMRALGTQADIDQQNKAYQDWYNMVTGNVPNEFGRTPKMENTLRNLGGQYTPPAFDFQRPPVIPIPK